MFEVLDAMVYAGKPDLGLQALGCLREPPTSAGLFYIDDEPDMGSEANVDAAIGAALLKLARYRAVQPAAKFGFYGLTPINNFWGIVDPARAAQLAALNTLTAPLARAADVLFPCLYNYYEPTADAAKWQLDAASSWWRFALGTIAEARRLAPGKPVVPFVWPQYFTGGRYVAADVWVWQLRLIRETCDGLVLWGDQSPWFPGEWWPVTRRVLNI